MRFRFVSQKNARLYFAAFESVSSSPMKLRENCMQISSFFFTSFNIYSWNYNCAAFTKELGFCFKQYHQFAKSSKNSASQKYKQFLLQNDWPKNFRSHINWIITCFRKKNEDAVIFQDSFQCTNLIFQVITWK